MTRAADDPAINRTKGTIMASTLFLRRILAMDSASCAIMGVAMSLAAPGLAPLLGLPEDLIRTAGLLLLPLAAFILWLASRPAPPPVLVWIVILGNLVWTAESFALLGQMEPTPLGTAFVSIQALAVLGLAGLEYVGLRRIRQAAA
jgi:hypothetical protein